MSDPIDSHEGIPMTYSPPAELVERVAKVLVKSPHAWEICSEAYREYWRSEARACLAASGLGEAVTLLRRLVLDWRLERNDDPQFSDPLANDARALLARLDTQNE